MSGFFSDLWLGKVSAATAIHIPGPAWAPPSGLWRSLNGAETRDFFAVMSTTVCVGLVRVSRGREIEKALRWRRRK